MPSSSLDIINKKYQEINGRSNPDFIPTERSDQIIEETYEFSFSLQDMVNPLNLIPNNFFLLDYDYYMDNWYNCFLEPMIQFYDLFSMNIFEEEDDICFFNFDDYYEFETMYGLMITNDKKHQFDLHGGRGVEVERGNGVEVGSGSGVGVGRSSTETGPPKTKIRMKWIYEPPPKDH